MPVQRFRGLPGLCHRCLLWENNNYVNKYISSFGEFYVHQECGAPVAENIVDTTKCQWAYVKWVREGFERARQLE